MDTCMYMAESLHCSPETITTLLISHTLIGNTKFKKQSNKGLQLGRPGLGRQMVGLGHIGSDNLSQTIRMDCDHANHTGETHTYRQVAREKAFLSDKCKEIEESNRMEKTRDLLEKIRIPR